MPPLATPDAVVVESVSFRSGPDALEGELSYPEVRPPRGAVVLAGPHPLLGGTMHNNVVRGLGAGLALRGLVTLRFNYRGVGQARGPTLHVAAHLAQFWETSHTPDELHYRFDLTAAVDFLCEAAGDRLPRALVGYSFGCTLLPHAAAGTTAPLVLIAPTVGVHDYDAYESLQNPTLVIASEDDFAADIGRLEAWFDGLPGPREMLRGRLDNHFFRGHEAWLADRVGAFLDKHWRHGTWG